VEESVKREIISGFHIRTQEIGDCGEIITQLAYDGPCPKTMEEAWEMTFTKWIIASEHKLSFSGGSSTCGLCVKSLNCESCPMHDYYPCCTNDNYKRYIYTRDCSYAKLFLRDLREVKRKIDAKKKRCTFCSTLLQPGRDICPSCDDKICQLERRLKAVDGHVFRAVVQEAIAKRRG